MNTLDTIKSRRSCKDYEPEKYVPKEIIEKIVEAGTCSATGMNRQSPIMLVISNKEDRDMLAKWNAEVLGVNTDTFYNAPQMIVVLAKRDVSTHVYDGSIVMANMMLAAEELGIGSCWIHRAREVFDSEKGKKFLKNHNINDDYEGIGNLAIGYAAGEKRKAPEIKDNYIYWI